ncbi:hypothetical protein BZA05DRAFT_441778 [Tricharina praecox]|uniref:uncharacterized protein n=1 Tax=Tricharina praecox TaxID=43433 RepID=UPI0022200CF5|nr:uncharacterized protein BZA05DRAFT_441778 [Tricharina praecox]KAI5857143.1 hypothetical protein BZA05DRAFT_441778 [Tricharina praecox]
MDLPFLSSSSDSDSDSDPKTSPRTSKLQQSESQFQAQKLQWRPVIYPVAVPANPKADAERKYYERDYEGALECARNALAVLVEGKETVVDRKELGALVEACRRKLAK